MPTLPTHFNRSAFTYDHHSLIQKTMSQHLLHNMKKIVHYSPQSILDIGCGTGCLTELIHRTYPNSTIDAIDIAPNMLDVARQKFPNNRSIQFIHQNAEAETLNWSQNTSYDLIVSNAAFQWFAYPLNTLRNLNHRLNMGGHIIASTFGPETFCELISLFKEVEQDMGLVDTENVHHLPMKSRSLWLDIYKHAGYSHISITEKKEYIHYPNCLYFLRSIKGIGANFSQNKHPLSIQKKVLQEVMKRYDDTFRHGDVVYVTYHTLYMQGQRA